MGQTYNAERAHKGEVYDSVALLAVPDDLALVRNAKVSRHGVEDVHGPEESDERETYNPVCKK